MRVAPKIMLTEEERVELNRLVRSKVANVRLVQCECIILLAVGGAIANNRLPIIWAYR